MLEKKWLRQADPARGRFRTFLLAALRHFLANEWHRNRALKRGGGDQWVALDALEAEERYALEPREKLSADILYERRWALTIVARAQDRLRDEMIGCDEGARFTALEPALGGERTDEGYRQMAERLNVSVNTVKSWVLRLRRRSRALLLNEIAQTLGEGQDPETELREILSALSS